MIVKAVEMIREVRVAIDMNRSDDSLIGMEDVDALSLDEIIRQKLPDAARSVCMEAPLNMLESGHDFGNEIFLNEDGSGFIILPHDFMRLLAFRMSDWSRTLYEAIGVSDPRYAMQSSRWSGIRGCPEKPVCAIVRRSEGKVLEFWSSKDADAVVAQAVYFPYPEIDSQDRIDIPDECYRAAVYRAAALALAAVGDQLAASMLDLSKSLLSDR